MMKAPLRPGTRPVGAAHASSKRHVDQRACSRRHPWGDGPRPQDRRGGVRVLYLLITKKKKFFFSSLLITDLLQNSAFAMSVVRLRRPRVWNGV